MQKIRKYSLSAMTLNYNQIVKLPWEVPNGKKRQKTRPILIRHSPAAVCCYHHHKMDNDIPERTARRSRRDKHHHDDSAMPYHLRSAV